jgi:hypothetical protein
MIEVQRSSIEEKNSECSDLTSLLKAKFMTTLTFIQMHHCGAKFAEKKQ